MKAMTLSELGHFLRIQSVCLLFAILLLATHSQFSINQEFFAHYFYLGVVAILAVGSIVQTTIRGGGRKRLFSLGFLYGAVTLSMLAMFFIR